MLPCGIDRNKSGSGKNHFTIQSGKCMNQGYYEIYRDLSRRQYQEKIIEYLSNLNFHFVNYSTLHQYKQGLEAYKDYQFMLRPLGESYDFKFFAIIKIMGTHVDHYFLRHPSFGPRIHGVIKKMEIPWKVGQVINMRKKKVLTKFPDTLSIQDRIDWRKIAHKVSMKRAVDITDLAWYEKYRKIISKMNPHRIDLIEPAILN